MVPAVASSQGESPWSHAPGIGDARWRPRLGRRTRRPKAIHRRPASIPASGRAGRAAPRRWPVCGCRNRGDRRRGTSPASRSRTAGTGWRVAGSCGSQTPRACGPPSGASQSRRYRPDVAHAFRCMRSTAGSIRGWTPVALGSSSGPEKPGRARSTRNVRRESRTHRRRRQVGVLEQVQEYRGPEHALV